MEAIQRDNLRREQENKRRELEEGYNETETSTVEEVIEGGASKEMGSTVSDEVKNGLVADDPWLQRKLLEEASASNSANDTALDDTINQVSGGSCKT